MVATNPPTPARLRRLWEELAEGGLALDLERRLDALLVEEIDNALRPHVHERRVSSTGSIIQPTADAARWGVETLLTFTRRPIGSTPLVGARRFADGLSSWLIRRLPPSPDDPAAAGDDPAAAGDDPAAAGDDPAAAGDDPAAAGDEWLVFDRPAGSERDLVVLAHALGATIVQRHPTGSVRVVGTFGVMRWEGLTWHREPPISSWIDAVAACPVHGDRDVLETLLEFAVHDLGSRGIGAILIYRPDAEAGPVVESRLSKPPPLSMSRPSDLAPLRHALAQVDGAAVFDPAGTLRQLGVRLVPSTDAESSVAGLRGMRHTSGRRYSYDDPAATVIVVSEDGPVTVLRAGELIGASSGNESVL